MTYAERACASVLAVIYLSAAVYAANRPLDSTLLFLFVAGALTAGYVAIQK